MSADSQEQLQKLYMESLDFKKTVKDDYDPQFDCVASLP